MIVGFLFGGSVWDSQTPAACISLVLLLGLSSVREFSGGLCSFAISHFHGSICDGILHIEWDTLYLGIGIGAFGF